MDDALKIIIGGIVGLLGKIVFDWLSSRKRNGTSGEQNIDYWRREIRDIVRDVMRERNETLENMFRRVLREEGERRSRRYDE